MFDVVVIGRGMIGSAAARHLAESGRSVALVGPDEPADWTTWDGPFSSHGDQGRITRIGDADPVWADLARRSIGRYGDIEQRSGISFHRACGLLVATADTAGWVETARAAGADVEPLDPDEVELRTGVTLPPGSSAALEGPPAGMIDPRRLVAAQNVLARRAGASIVARAVDGLDVDDDGVTVGGPWGSVRAERAVVATGAFGHHLLDPVLDGPLGVIRRPRTVLLAEYGPIDGPPLPSLILKPAPDRRLESVYWVPPVAYPDGRICLKIGGSLASNPVVGSGGDGEAELVAWFHGAGDPVEAEALRVSLDQLLPGRTPRSTSTVPCVYTGTESGYPIIDRLPAGTADDRVVVAIGGNGSSAKSSDELGRLAAALATDGALGSTPDPAVFGLTAASPR